MIQIPMILKSPLTGSYFCVTKYKVLGNGQIESKNKFDVNQQIQRIIKEEIRARRKKRKDRTDARR